MLIRRYRDRPFVLVAIGLVALVIGLVLGAVAFGTTGADGASDGPLASDFWRRFAHGLAGTLTLLGLLVGGVGWWRLRPGRDR